MSDTQIWNDNLPEFGFAPSVHVARLAISVADGRLILKWLVETLEPARDYEIFDAPAEGANSVVDIAGQQLHACQNPTDAETHAAATLRLEWDLAVPLHCVQVAVEHGAVTLTGEVEWQGQRLAAERDVISLPGVIALFNRITVREEGDACQACDRIGHSAHPAWLFEPNIIQFPR